VNAETLINLNNEKRKLLNPENLKYYEDMLVYIRLSYDKSVQETEEVLLELLDHLLEAQAEGRTAREVFGDDPKRYADQIVGELPRMVTKKRVLLIAMTVLYFLATATLTTGIVDLVFYVMGKRGLTSEVFVGTVIVKTLVTVPLAVLFVFGLLQYLRWSCFKTVNKILEFGVFWLFGVLPVGLFMLVVFFTPQLGYAIEYPFYYNFVIGGVLLAAARVTRKMG